MCRPLAGAKTKQKLAQFNWQVTGQTGQKYAVGIYHGLSTGHLVVHCNSRVVLIDFNVNQPKTYSFLLDRDLCELKINREDNQYTYNLDLPDALPEISTREISWDNYYAFGTLVAFFLTIYLLVVWLRPYIPS